MMMLPKGNSLMQLIELMKYGRNGKLVVEEGDDQAAVEFVK